MKKEKVEEKDTAGPVGDMGERLGVRSVATNPYGNTKVSCDSPPAIAVACTAPRRRSKNNRGIG